MRALRIDLNTNGAEGDLPNAPSLTFPENAIIKSDMHVEKSDDVKFWDDKRICATFGVTYPQPSTALDFLSAGTANAPDDLQHLRDVAFYEVLRRQYYIIDVNRENMDKYLRWITTPLISDTKTLAMLVEACNTANVRKALIAASTDWCKNMHRKSDFTLSNYTIDSYLVYENEVFKISRTATLADDIVFESFVIDADGAYVFPAQSLFPAMREHLSYAFTSKDKWYTARWLPDYFKSDMISLFKYMAENDAREIEEVYRVFTHLCQCILETAEAGATDTLTALMLQRLSRSNPWEVYAKKIMSRMQRFLDGFRMFGMTEEQYKNLNSEFIKSARDMANRLLNMSTHMFIEYMTNPMDGLSRETLQNLVDFIIAYDKAEYYVDYERFMALRSAIKSNGRGVDANRMQRFETRMKEIRVHKEMNSMFSTLCNLRG